MKINAYAKINLTLDIVGIREDGFHSLRSVMAPVSLCDEVTLTISEGFAFDCDKKELCTADNLCVSAAKLFFANINADSAVSIHLKKNIPFPAGLGGGSSDAAAVLSGLNEMFGRPLDERTLFSLASSLGSDVPFCLLSKPALCEGRGEILTPLDGFCELDTVIAIGKERLSTPKVFSEYDKMELPVENSTDMFVRKLNECGVREAIRFVGNAFEPVTDNLAPETKSLRQEMLAAGATVSHLSGSGPSVYGLFENSEKAQSASEILKNKGYFAVYCKTVI